LSACAQIRMGFPNKKSLSVNLEWKVKRDLDKGLLFPNQDQIKKLRKLVSMWSFHVDLQAFTRI
jgi:hypothetical protein